jgi:hypothetical protein
MALGNDRYLRIPSIQGTNREGQLRVESRRSSSVVGMTATTQTRQNDARLADLLKPTTILTSSVQCPRFIAI